MISPGIISALRTLNSQPVIQVTAPISHGSSGGPIVNSVGEVVGVAQGSLSEGQNLNFAVPAELVSLLISKTNMQITTSETQAWKNTEGNNWAWLVSGGPSIEKTSKAQQPSIIGALRQGESRSTASLRKLPGVRLLIEELDEDTKRILNERQIQTDVELRLRRNGIRLLSSVAASTIRDAIGDTVDRFCNDFLAAN